MHSSASSRTGSAAGFEAACRRRAAIPRKALGPKARAVAGITLTPREKGPPKIALRLRDGDAAAARLLDEIRKGPPRGSEGDLPPIDMSDYLDEDLATVRAIMERAMARRNARVGQQRRQIELGRSQYQEADSKD